MLRALLFYKQHATERLARAQNSFDRLPYAHQEMMHLFRAKMEGEGPLLVLGPVHVRCVVASWSGLSAVPPEGVCVCDYLTLALFGGALDYWWLLLVDCGPDTLGTYIGGAWVSVRPERGGGVFCVWLFQ